MTVVSLDNLGSELSRILAKTGSKNRQRIGVKVASLPRRAQAAASRYYWKVFRTKGRGGQATGRMLHTISGVSRRVGKEQWAVGLSAATEYAHIQEYGGRTSPHTIVPRRKKALHWVGAEHPVKRVEHPGSNIKPKHFLGNPLKDVAGEIFSELKKEIGF